MGICVDSDLLAQKVWDFENADQGTKREWIKNGRKPVKLGENLSMKLSEDHLCWYITYYPDEYYNSQDFMKVVPRFWVHSVKQIATILKAQSWSHL